MPRTLTILATTLLLCGAAPLSARSVAPVPAPAADETSATYKKLLESVGSALVTVKFVMKVDGGAMGGDEAGRDVETTGLMMEAGGLVLVSNAKMGGLASRMGGVSVNPTNVRILIGDDTEGLKAKILARDSELDLCWVSVDDDKAKDKKFPFVDFSASGAAATPSVGDRIYVVERMGKFFDHALSVNEGRIGGSTRKPRPLMIPSGFGGSQREMLGAPMFNSDAKVVGVNIFQLPDKEDMEGGDSGGEGNFGVLLLPAAEVVKATVRGKELAAKAPKEEPKSEADPKKDAPTPEDTKKDEPKKP